MGSSQNCRLMPSDNQFENILLRLKLRSVPINFWFALLNTNSLITLLFLSDLSIKKLDDYLEYASKVEDILINECVIKNGLMEEGHQSGLYSWEKFSNLSINEKQEIESLIIKHCFNHNQKLNKTIDYLNQLITPRALMRDHEYKEEICCKKQENKFNNKDLAIVHIKVSQSLSELSDSNVKTKYIMLSNEAINADNTNPASHLNQAISFLNQEKEKQAINSLKKSRKLFLDEKQEEKYHQTDNLIHKYLKSTSFWKRVKITLKAFISGRTKEQQKQKMEIRHSTSNNFYGSFNGNIASSNNGEQIFNQYNNGSIQKQTLAEVAAEIQQLLNQLEQTNPKDAQQQAAKNLVQKAQSNSTLRGNLIKWGQSLGDTAAKTTVSEAVKGVFKLALFML